MSKKIRRIAVLSLCVVMFAAVQPACAGSAVGSITGAVRGASEGSFWGKVVGGIVGFCIGGPDSAVTGAKVGGWIGGTGGAVAGGANGYNMTPEEIEKAQIDVMLITLDVMKSLQWDPKRRFGE